MASFLVIFRVLLRMFGAVRYKEQYIIAGDKKTHFKSGYIWICLMLLIHQLHLSLDIMIMINKHSTH